MTHVRTPFLPYHHLSTRKNHTPCSTIDSTARTTRIDTWSSKHMEREDTGSQPERRTSMGTSTRLPHKSEDGNQTSQPNSSNALVACRSRHSYSRPIPWDLSSSRRREHNYGQSPLPGSRVVLVPSLESQYGDREIRSRQDEITVQQRALCPSSTGTLDIQEARVPSSGPRQQAGLNYLRQTLPLNRAPLSMSLDVERGNHGVRDQGVDWDVVRVRHLS